MELEEKKKILLSIISATKKEETINHLISEAWAREIAPTRSMVQKEGKPIKKYGPRRPITVHGQVYPSVRSACLKGWGMNDGEYKNFLKRISVDGVEIEDVLKPRDQPLKKMMLPNGEIIN